MESGGGGERPREAVSHRGKRERVREGVSHGELSEPGRE